MILNTLPKKIGLAVMITYSSVIWLNTWHEYGFSSSPVVFPHFSTSLRDSAIILMPVILAVLSGITIMQWVMKRFGERISPATQSILSAAILGSATSLAILLTETNRIFQTGVGTEFIFLTSICRVLYPNGNFLLRTLQLVLPGYQAVRFHILLQDGANLILVNLAVTIFVIMILEGFAKTKNMTVLKQHRKNEPALENAQKH